MPIALWHIFWNSKLFQTYTQLNLNSWIGGKQAGEKPIPVQMQSFEYGCFDWLYGLIMVPPEEMSGAEK